MFFLYFFHLCCPRQRLVPSHSYSVMVFGIYIVKYQRYILYPYAPLSVNLVPEALQLITLRILAGKSAYLLSCV